ncbi:MAG: hypothetical protein H6970_07435 [Gammaproteobacteria bacterium]|nr:hypothetical protein [Gammaproteobacteria bacterium]MCP5424886.1 hypothetical protein [Gammaproteobacteria bacterium]MCP5458138.1 hypothetical protein [Gammaproteobacteria bacterium]
MDTRSSPTDRYRRRLNSTVGKIVIRPNARLRRRVLWGLVAALLLGFLTIYGVNDYAWSLVHSDDPLDHQKLIRLAHWIIFAMPVGVFALVGWLLWLARRIFETGQFPLPGQKVIRPTVLRTGGAARRMAWSLIVISIALLVLEILLTYYAMQVIWSLDSTA